MNEEITVALPTSKDALESFINQILLFNPLIPTGDDTDEAIATMILHQPSHLDHIPLRIASAYAAKSAANKVAYEMIDGFRKKRAQAEADQKAAEEKPPASVEPIQNS